MADRVGDGRPIYTCVTDLDDVSRASLGALNRLRVIGFLEGVSFLVLLGIAMPLKYLAGRPEMVRYVGWTHGLLFTAFVATVALVARRLQWSYDQVAGAVVAALLPGGTFVLDKRLKRAILEIERRGTAIQPATSVPQHRAPCDAGRTGA